MSILPETKQIMDRSLPLFGCNGSEFALFAYFLSIIKSRRSDKLLVFLPHNVAFSFTKG